MRFGCDRLKEQPPNERMHTMCKRTRLDKFTRRLRNGGFAVFRLADDGKVRFGFQEGDDAEAGDGVVVDDEDSNGSFHVSRGEVE